MRIVWVASRFFHLLADRLMRSLLDTHLKRGIVWAMLPLALVSGLPTPRCRCSAGERPITCSCPCCQGKSISSGVVRTGQCRCCGQCCLLRNRPANDDADKVQSEVFDAAQVACCVPSGAVPRHGTPCCVPVAVDPSVIAPSIEAPDASATCCGFVCSEASKPIARHSSSVLDAGHLHCGPDADLVVVFRCLLI